MPPGRTRPHTGTSSKSFSLRGHAPSAAVFAAAATLCMWPMFAPGSPPGVDTPTFLHLAWVVELALTGRLEQSLVDPYWYGGWPYAQAYPPLAYGLTGLISAASPIPVETAYRIVLFIALAGLGLSVYALALEHGLRRVPAVLAGLLTMTSYPALTGLAVYGWFPTMAALPLGVAGLTMLERSLRSGAARTAVAAGVLLAAMVLAHHMTGFAFALALGPWLAYRLAGAAPERMRMLRTALIAAGTAFALTAVWAAFFVAHLVRVGFEREVPGNWNVGIAQFLARLLDRSHIGVEVYPTYMGAAIVVLGLVGLFYALLTRPRAVALAPPLLVMTWFAAGQQVNPLIGLYPFSGLDIARFALFMAPFLALFAAVAMDAAAGSLPPVRLGSVAVSPALATGLACVLALAIPAADVAAMRGAMAPVVQGPDVQRALGWLEEHTPPEAVIVDNGLRNWGSWWIPYRTGRFMMGGWQDEGAVHWRPAREVRRMGWRREVDAERLHAIMEERGAEYLLVVRRFASDSPRLFEEEARGAPHLFELQAAWDTASIYRVVVNSEQ